jgi:phosphoribosylaminoimidazole (AIR) synthetase
MPLSAKVYTTTGQLLDAVVVNEQAQIHLAAGIYIIRIHINGYSMVRKIFIS